jgi:hypothetical protein
MQLMGNPDFSTSCAIYEGKETTELLKKVDRVLVNDYGVIEKGIDGQYKLDTYFEKTLKNFFMFGMDEIFPMKRFEGKDYAELLKRDHVYPKWLNLYKHIFKEYHLMDDLKPITENIEKTL